MLVQVFPFGKEVNKILLNRISLMIKLDIEIRDQIESMTYTRSVTTREPPAIEMYIIGH